MERAMQASGNEMPGERAVLVTAALGTMLAPLNSTMIVVALPRMLSELDRPLAWGSWVIISYLVAMAAVQPLGGSLGDRYGRRRLLLTGLGIFLVATAVAALAPTIELLIVARTVQAISGAVVIPNGTALVRSLVAPERQGRAFGGIGAAVAVAAAIGPVLGGVITDVLGWRWIFAANLLLIVPAVAIVRRLPADSGNRAGRFDLAGGALLTVSLVSLALALTVWRLDAVPLAAAPVLGVVAVAGWLALRRHARRVSRPVLDVGLLQRRAFLPAALSVMLSNMVMYTVLLSLPVYLSRRQGWSGSEVGFLLAGMSAQMVVFSPIGGRLADRYGRRLPALTGAALAVAGVAPFVAIGQVTGWAAYLAPLVVLGAGIGLAAAPVQAAAVQAVPPAQTGQAAGLFSTMRYLGSITGAGVMAAVLTGATPSLPAFRLLYAFLLAIAIAAVLAASRLEAWESAAAPIGHGAEVRRA